MRRNGAYVLDNLITKTRFICMLSLLLKVDWLVFIVSNLIDFDPLYKQLINPGFMTFIAVSPAAEGRSSSLCARFMCI